MAITRSGSPRFSRRTVLALAGSSLVAACGGGDGGRRSWNPFGKKEEVTSLEPEGGYATARSDPRPLVPRVDSMVIERVTGGIIVRASGVMPTQEYWDANLVPAVGENPRNGVYRLDFRAWPPFEGAQAQVGTSKSRELTAAAFIKTGELDGVRTIQVVAASGGLSRSR